MLKRSRKAATSDHPDFHSTGLGTSIENHGVLLMKTPLAQLEKSEDLFVSLRIATRRTLVAMRRSGGRCLVPHRRADA
jgi:hypothetical protein